MFGLRSHIRTLAHSRAGRQDKKDEIKERARLLFHAAAEFVVKPVSRLSHRSQTRAWKNKTLALCDAARRLFACISVCQKRPFRCGLCAGGSHVAYAPLSVSKTTLGVHFFPFAFMLLVAETVERARAHHMATHTWPRHTLLSPVLFLCRRYSAVFSLDICTGEILLSIFSALRMGTPLSAPDLYYAG